MSPRFLHLTVTSGSWKCSDCLIFSHAANVDLIWKLEFSLAIKLTLRKVETVFKDCNYGLTRGEKCPWEFSPQFIHRAPLLWWNIYYVILDNYCLFFVCLSPQIMIQRGSVFKTCCLQSKNHRLAYLFPQLHAHTHSNRSHQSPPCPMQSQLA